MRRSRVRRTDATDGTLCGSIASFNRKPNGSRSRYPIFRRCGIFFPFCRGGQADSSPYRCQGLCFSRKQREQHVHLFQTEFRRIQQRKIRKSDNRQLRLRSDQYGGHHFINNGQARFSRYACTKIRRMGLFCQRCRHCVCVLPEGGGSIWDQLLSVQLQQANCIELP